jgi:hypothetical protein
MRRLVLAALTLSVMTGLAGCGSSDAAGTPTPTLVASAPATTQAATTVPVTTLVASAAPTTLAPAATEAPSATTSEEVVVSDADVADMEKELDDIDQLLSGVDADLSRD